MAEYRPCAGVEQGRPQPCLDREGGVANCKNPAMKAVEPPGSEPPGDHGVAQAQITKLLTAYDAALPDNQRLKGFCVDLCPTVGRNSTQKEHGVDPWR